MAVFISYVVIHSLTHSFILLSLSQAQLDQALDEFCRSQQENADIASKASKLKVCEKEGSRVCVIIVSSVIMSYAAMKAIVMINDCFKGELCLG